MERKSRFLALAIIGVLLILFGCKKEDAKAPPSAPIVTIAPVVKITTSSASSGGNITNDGGLPITARGVCWSINPNPTTADNKTTDGTGTGIFTSAIIGLIPNTTYHLKSYAVSSAGTGYSTQETFSTMAQVPILDTVIIYPSSSSPIVLLLKLNVLNDGGSPIIARGICWSTNQNPTIADNKTIEGTGTGIFTSSIPLSSFVSSVIYWIRAYATSVDGTGYSRSSGILFGPGVLPDPNTVSDINGNRYGTVKIGTQVWMTSNLCVTKYRNGDPIPSVKDASTWGALTTGAYDGAYGYLLYNGFAVYDSRNIAPEGWHIPSMNEWNTLSNFLGGDGLAGGPLKEKGYAHWKSPNTGGNNETGFTALPGGWKNPDGTFQEVGINGRWWTSTQSNSADAWHRKIIYSSSSLEKYVGSKKLGLSVRCIKD